ncbi:unnamed protein product, partial [marine sediment metagenome]
TNDEMLERVREDRPNQVIHEVLGFKKNKFGFYTVEVDMEVMFLKTKVLHAKHKIPYPISLYGALSELKQQKYKFDLM